MPSIATHLNNFTESVIREMTRVANKYNAINLSQGFPDFDPPAELISAAKKAMDEGPHQYSITWGHQISERPLPESRAIGWDCPSTPMKTSWSPVAVPRQ